MERFLSLSATSCLAAVGLLCFSFLQARAQIFVRPPLETASDTQKSLLTEVGDGYGPLLDSLNCEKLSKLAARQEDRLSQSDTLPLPTYTLSYGANKAQALDVYTPPLTKDLAPIIIMVHGGAWCVGDKRASNVILNKINRWRPQGFLFVSVNYRMLPDNADVLSQAGDVAQAIAYVQTHASQWHGNPSKIILMGHSAGAHLVSLLSSDTKLAAHFGASPWLGTISLDSAALNVFTIMRSPHPSFYDDAFGSDPSFWLQSSPLEHLSSSSLPWLGVCSTKRKDSCSQAYLYSKKAGQYGIKAGVLEENLSHGNINAELGRLDDYTTQVELFMSSLDRDIQKHLSNGASFTP